VNCGEATKTTQTQQDEGRIESQMKRNNRKKEEGSRCHPDKGTTDRLQVGAVRGMSKEGR
jgi:hypothetical protein